MATVFLKPKRAYSVIHHHPWIFSGAVQRVEGTAEPGEIVAVADERGRTLGYGAWSPASQIRVRMLRYSATDRRTDAITPCAPPDAAYVKELVAAAVARRAGFRAAADTTACRLTHGEADGLPGVTADLYDTTVVLQLASAGADRARDTLADAFMACVPGCTGVYERSDVDARAREGLPPRTGLLRGAEPPEFIEIREGRIRYYVDVRNGHKTGFYLDQRDARAQVGAYAAGRDCLNCFSYTGGFGLACAAHGARSVINLDLSRPALDLAARNFDLTFPEGKPDVSFTCADVFKQLRLYRDQGRTFGLIVLDPPKFADTKAQLVHAARGYKDINLLAMKLLEPGGILATFSCSGAMTPAFFDTICAEAAFDARRDFQILARTRQAPDHPESLAFPEGLYLKGLVLRG